MESPLSFLRFSWRLSRSALVLAWKTLKLGEGIRGTVVSVVFLTGVSVAGVVAWLQQYVSPWLLVGLLLVLFILGLFRASYEIEVEKRALEDKIETEEKRAAIAGELQQLYRQGLELRAGAMGSDDESPASEWQDALLEWRQNVFGYLHANVSVGKAEYVDAVTSVSAVFRSGMKSNTTRREKETIVSHIDERLQRLAEVVREY